MLKKLHPEVKKNQEVTTEQSCLGALTFISESPVITQVTTCYCSSRAAEDFLSISLSVSPFPSVPLLL